MLNGIGGATIKEAKERMTLQEFFDWSEYIKRRGSLDLGNRTEYGFALVAQVVNNAAGGKAKMTDFLPKREEPETSIHDVFSMIKSRAQVNNRRVKRNGGS